ncbi:amidase [Mycobacterium tuberculosis]|nr:amidase [Mycobacterium tuberculosis]
MRRSLRAIDVSQPTLNAFRVVLTESALADAAAAASASADSVSTTRKAFNVGWLTSIARRERRTNSSDVTARVASW